MKSAPSKWSLSLPIPIFNTNICIFSLGIRQVTIPSNATSRISKNEDSQDAETKTQAVSLSEKESSALLRGVATCPIPSKQFTRARIIAGPSNEPDADSAPKPSLEEERLLGKSPTSSNHSSDEHESGLQSLNETPSGENASSLDTRELLEALRKIKHASTSEGSDSDDESGLSLSEPNSPRSSLTLDTNEKDNDQNIPRKPVSETDAALPYSTPEPAGPKMMDQAVAEFYKELTGSSVRSFTHTALHPLSSDTKIRLNVLSTNLVSHMDIPKVLTKDEVSDKKFEQLITDKLDNIRPTNFENISLKEIESIFKPLFSAHRLWKTREQSLGLTGFIESSLNTIADNLSPAQLRALFEALLLYNFVRYPATEATFDDAADAAISGDYYPAKEFILGTLLHVVFQVVPLSDQEIKNFYNTIFSTAIYERIQALDASKAGADFGVSNQLNSLATVIISKAQKRGFLED